MIADWTSQRSREEVETLLQARGLESVAVLDYADLHADPQLAARDHFVTLPHAVAGEWLFERNGIRLGGTESGYHKACPILGEHTESILREQLGLSEQEVQMLLASPGVETEPRT